MTSVSLAIIGPGGSFGELALSKDSKDGKRTATIVAREMSEFLVISKDVYLEKLSKYQEMHLRERVSLIQNSNVFRTLPWSTKVLQTVCYPMERHVYPLDTVLLKQGTKASALYMLERGEANVFKNIKLEKLGDDGKPQFVNMPLGRLGPGDCFGFRAAAGDTYGARTRHNVTIVSTSPVIVHSLTRYDIFNRIDPTAKAELRRWSSTYEDDILLSRQMENYENLNKIKQLYRKELFPPKYIHRMEKKSKDVVEMVNEKLALKRFKRYLNHDVPHNSISERRYSLAAQRIALKTTSLKETQTSYRRHQLALGRSGVEKKIQSSTLSTKKQKSFGNGKGRKSGRKSKKRIVNSQSAPNLRMDASIEKYEMWTLPMPSKTVKKGWATPQPNSIEKERILKKLEMKTLDLQPVPRESVMTKDGKRRKLPKMVL